MSGRIMVVDDDQDARTALALFLEGRGFQVIRAEDGLQASILLRKPDNKPDLIILDYFMPGFRGTKFLDWLKGLGHADIPVILATSYPLEKLAILLDPPRLQGHQKPVEFDVLLAQIERALERRPPGP